MQHLWIIPILPLAGFVINEFLVRAPWAHVDVLFSRNVGLALVVILLYTLTSLSNSSLVPNFLGTVGQLRPEQTGELLLIYGALPMFVMVPVSTVLLRHVDPRIVLTVGLSAFAGASLLGTQLTHDWARGDFVTIVMLQSIGQALACERMTVLLVAYFARPDLPAYLGDIRLEYFFAVLESREMHSLPSQHSLLSQACRDEASGDADGDPCT